MSEWASLQGVLVAVGLLLDVVGVILLSAEDLHPAWVWTKRRARAAVRDLRHSVERLWRRVRRRPGHVYAKAGTASALAMGVSGPVVLEYHADGSVTETDYGPQFERPPGQLLLTTGPVVWQYDSNFNVISYTQIGGTSQDVCALLG